MMEGVNKAQGRSKQCSSDLKLLVRERQLLSPVKDVIEPRVKGLKDVVYAVYHYKVDTVGRSVQLTLKGMANNKGRARRN